MSKKPFESPALRVRLTRPGVVACGPYQAGIVYEVEAEEARRLVEVKGFEIVPDTPFEHAIITLE
jgi:hypothetical protein